MRPILVDMSDNERTTPRDGSNAGGTPPSVPEIECKKAPEGYIDYLLSRQQRYYVRTESEPTEHDASES